MKPFWIRLDGSISDVVALPSGELAVLTDHGISIVDRSLKLVDRIPWEGDRLYGHVTPLVDGRFIVATNGFTKPKIGARGGTLALLDPAPDAPYLYGIVAVPSGYFGVKQGSLEELSPKSVHSWNDGALVAGRHGFAIYDAAGDLQTTVKVELGDGSVFGDRLLSLPMNGTAVTCVNPDGTTAWTWSPGDAIVMAPIVMGDQVVFGAWGMNMAWVLDRDGQVVREIPLPAPLSGAGRLGSEIAVGWSNSRTIAAGDVRLEHDGQPTIVRGLPNDELATTEGDLLLVWRPNEDGPEPPALASAIPIGVPIVVNGWRCLVEEPGRFAMRGRAGDGRPISIPADAESRLALTPAEAAALMTRLNERPSVDPLAGKSEDDRDGFIAELGAALEMSPRRIRAAIRARRFPLEPPRPIPDYEYLGLFTTTGKLAVSDPCYFNKSAKGGFALNVDGVEGTPGNWHAFVRAVEDRVGELVCIHESGFDVVANEQIGSAAVDSGMAGVFDKACPRPEPGNIEDGIVAQRLGAMASTGHGDGFYPVFAGKKAQVVKIRIYYLGDTAELDGTVARAAVSAEAKKYMATERYAVGDAIEHKKFGRGVVTRLAGDKIDVSFSGETRTLVHGLQ